MRARALVRRQPLGGEGSRMSRHAGRVGSVADTTKATMRWPRSSSGTPTTATSATAGWSSSDGLDLAGADLEPAGLDDVDRGPADDAVEPVAVDRGRVAGDEPTVAVPVGRRGRRT